MVYLTDWKYMGLTLASPIPCTDYTQNTDHKKETKKECVVLVFAGEGRTTIILKPPAASSSTKVPYS